METSTGCVRKDVGNHVNMVKKEYVVKYATVLPRNIQKYRFLG